MSNTNIYGKQSLRAHFSGCRDSETFHYLVKNRIVPNYPSAKEPLPDSQQINIPISGGGVLLTYTKRYSYSLLIVRENS